MTPTIRSSVRNKEELKIISLRKFARLTPHYLIDQSFAVAAALWEKR
jgi:hypothetical protein